MKRTAFYQWVPRVILGIDRTKNFYSVQNENQKENTNKFEFHALGGDSMKVEYSR